MPYMAITRAMLVLLLAGCFSNAGCSMKSLHTASAGGGGRGSIDAWASKQGGIIADHHHDLAVAALGSLEPALSGTGHQFSVRVLATDTLAACAWPSGDLFVSRGLVNQMSHQELTAAIAHEAAHVLADESPSHPSALTAANCAYDHESHADALGVQLLQRSGQPAQAMITMLRKVHQAQPLSSPVRLALEKRIDALR